MTEQQLKELQERNAARLTEAKEKLGTRWLLHPINKLPKLPQPKN